ESKTYAIRLGPGSETRDGGRVGPLPASLVPLPSDSKWYRRERDDEQRERHPREPAARRGQRPGCVEHRRMCETPPCQHQHEHAPYVPTPPPASQQDDDAPEHEGD